MPDVKVNLFEIAYLTWEQVNMFQSDFREVARYFVQMQEDGEYRPSDDEISHIESILQLLNVMDKDHRFELSVNERENAKEARTMSEWLTKVINESQAIVLKKGIEQGKFTAYADMVRKKRIPAKEAAEELGMTETDFCKEAGITVKQ